MAKKRRAHDEEAWTNAKKICRLTARQVEMARALGMNPKKLPGLRPSPQEKWKLPVGEFIEECYGKRFGGNPRPACAREGAAVSQACQPRIWTMRRSRARPGSGVPVERSGLLPHESGRRSAAVARPRLDRPRGAATGT